MAQLPPKVPSIAPHNQQQQWHEFMYPQQHHDDDNGQNPPWIDEFIEFSAAKRGAHRRSASESSVAFVEAGISGRNNNSNDTNNNNNNNDNNDEFDKFDDEQFLSMFSNELGGGSTSTSEHNSINDDQRKETTTMRTRTRTRRRELGGREKVEEVESACKVGKYEGQVQGQGQSQGGDEGSHNDIGCSGNVASVTTAGANCAGDVVHDQLQPVVDPKRIKRILANRQSAQRSRVRKLQYISELERSVTMLQSEVSALSPRVAFLDHQRMILNVDNSTLKAKIAALAQDKIFKDAHQEAMKREIERLRQVYYQQNLNKTESVVPPSSTSSLIPTTAQPQPPDTAVNENEQLTG